jgi:hypothetical protein
MDSLRSPQAPGYYLFHGQRTVRNNQRIAIDAPVEVLPIWKGQDSVLGVVMLGRQGRFALSQFEGTWSPIREARV